MKRRLILVFWMGVASCLAQNAPKAPAAPAAPSTPAADTGKSSDSGTASGSKESTSAGSDNQFLGKNVPFLDMGTDVVTWDGKMWNISNNRLLRARFEKYLVSAESTEKEYAEYQKIITQIIDKLSPEHLTSRAVDEAWAMLPKASNYAIDANLCDSLANAVYSVWLAKNQVDRLEQANGNLDRERDLLSWNAEASVKDSSVNQYNPPNDKVGQTAWLKDREMERTIRMQPYTVRIAEVEAMMKANRLKKEASDLQSKVEFQALLMQFFLQRRFQHVVIGTRFYRVIFGDGDNKMRVGNETAKAISNFSGMPPTLGLLESMANEAMRDVAEGVEAFTFLVEKKEMAGATDRLAEAFAVGEYMPPIRQLPREKKRQALDFEQKSNQLISALEVRDYTRAEDLVKEMQAVARDFDTSKPMAAIETARTVSAMHLSKARVAAASGDRATLETELKAATEIWPRNPDLAKISGSIFNQADVQQQALSDLQRLIAQKNYRQIFDDKVRYIAATALFPDQQEQLRKILDDMQLVESGIIRANEIAKAGNYAGAWENVERVFQKFPEDNKLNQVRADLTTQASDFVRSLRTAQKLERNSQVGSSLAWYLKAQSLYPTSEFAGEGIQRMVSQVMPDRK